MRVMTAYAVCFILGSLVGGGVAQAIELDPFQDPLVVEIQALHVQSQNGNKKATLKLIERLEQLLEEHQDHALLRAYLGSAYTLRSRDAFPGPNKLKYLKKGLRTLDAAVEGAPTQMAPRFIRAVNNFHLPGFFDRRKVAQSDFQKLVEQLSEGSHGLSPRTRQAIYYYAGLCFCQSEKKEEAIKSFRQGLALNADPELSEKIERELRRFK